jgi:ElaB/YqjD/DUF883 family membrane-anchored ribosome-binding protein
METNDAASANPSSNREKSIRDLLRDAEELIRAMGSQVADKAGDTRARLEGVFKEIKNRYAVAEAMVVDRTKEYAEKTDTFVRENPWRAVGLASGIGFLLGLLCARR